MKTSPWLFALVIATMAFACSREPKQQTDETEKAAPAQTQTRESSNTRDWMREHARIADEAMRAIVRGDTPDAKDAMAQLGKAFEARGFEKAMQQHAQAARLLATTGGRAESLEQVAATFSQLAQACGGCHESQKLGPPIQLKPVPRGTDIASHMRRHGWAIVRMWESLRVRSTPAFMAAVNVLDETPIHGAGKPDHERPAGVSEIGTSLHALATNARKSKALSLADQTDLFGKMLYKCGQCHSAVDASVKLTE